MNHKRWAFFCVFLTGGIYAERAMASYVVSPFDFPGAVSTFLSGINDSGDLVGLAKDSSGAYFGFVYRQGITQRLDGPTGNGKLDTYAAGISASGTIVGQWSGAGIGYHGLIYDASGYTTFDPQFAIFDPQFSINRITTLTGISSDGRYVSGTSGSASFASEFSFLLDRSVGADAPQVTPIFQMIAHGVNKSGTVVGYGNSGPGAPGLVYEASTGKLTTLNVIGATVTLPQAINDLGQIAGYAFVGGVGKSWLGDPSGHIEILDLPGAVSGINNLGQLVGSYDGLHGFVATPVVLPSSTTAGSKVFATSVLADKPIFIDPSLSTDYLYSIGVGDPLFKSVALPIGIGDNRYRIIVEGATFAVQGGEIFDFTTHGFAAGVSRFQVSDIEVSATNQDSPFVTRLTFSSDGVFTGTQSPVSQSPVPESPTLLLAIAGGLGIAASVRFRRLAKGSEPSDKMSSNRLA